jgi:hypothetical protein
MSPETRSELIELLERNRRELLDLAASFTEAQAAAKPDPERWSVLECVEHVALVEKRFLAYYDGASQADAPPMDKEREARLLAGVISRGQRVQAPEAVRPAARFATLSEAVAAFDAARAETLRFAGAQGAALYGYSLKHPRFGPVNGYEVMLIIAGHAGRHAAQIREIKKTAVS